MSRRVDRAGATAGALAGAPVAALVAALTTRAAAELTERLGPPSWPGWRRRNYRGRWVSLTGGGAAAAGAVGAATWCARPGWRLATIVAGTSAAVAGAYDDLLAPGRELGTDKGWAGHLQAVRAGRVSGGVVKVAGIGLGSVWAARLLTDSWRAAVPRAALIASSANLVNLFDLRPGRAAKIVTVVAVTQLRGPGAPAAAAVLGSAVAALPADLGETRMLGDLGANTLGALLGVSLAARGARARTGALALVIGLTAASERVSFSRVIDATPLLRAVDGWGRRPPERSAP